MNRKKTVLLRMLDYSGRELQDMPLSEFIFPYNVENDNRALIEIVSGKRRHYQFENGYLTPAGERIWGRLTLVTIPGRENESEFLIGIFDDPTGQNAVESEPHDADDRFPVGNEGTRILDFNRRKIDKGLICRIRTAERTVVDYDFGKVNLLKAYLAG